jgi:hypothetical protein
LLSDARLPLPAAVPHFEGKPRGADEYPHQRAVAHLLSMGGGGRIRCGNHRLSLKVMATTKGNMGQIRNPHPGEILKEEFLNEIGMSQNQLAYALGVPGNRIHSIVNGTRDIRTSNEGASAVRGGNGDRYRQKAPVRSCIRTGAIKAKSLARSQ